MFGNWSTCRRCRENMPSTSSASIIMVAKTGLFRLTRVNHITYFAPAARLTTVSASIGPTPPIKICAPALNPLTSTMVC